MKSCSVYVLQDENNRIRYVGITIHPLSVRLSQHICEAKKGGNNNKSRWIRGMMGEGHLPKIQLIEVVDNSVMGRKEREWIFYFRRLGLCLENQTNGGEGHKQTQETRDKISKALKGNKFSEEKRKRYLESWRNKKMSRKAIEAARCKNTGSVHTPEHIEKIRVKNLGRKQTEEAKEKLRIFHTGRHPSQETIEKLRISHAGKKRSQESLKKLSLSLVRSWKQRKLNMGESHVG